MKIKRTLADKYRERIKSEGDTHVSAGVRLTTSMTYAPEVTSGKSDCLSFSSLASLRNKANAPEELIPDDSTDLNMLMFGFCKTEQSFLWENWPGTFWIKRKQFDSDGLTY